MGQITESTEWRAVKFEQITGWQPSLVFLYKGILGLHGVEHNASYEEHEIPSGCTEVWFRGKIRILVIYSPIWEG